MQDIYKLIDDINVQKLDNLDTRVNDALSSTNDDALFILGETLFNFGLTPQAIEVFRTLYNKYPDEANPLILNGKNKGSWAGHITQYRIAQVDLSILIKKASNDECPATPNA